MKKARFIICIILLLQSGMRSSAQVLFRYGTDQVTKNEFLRAYLKNNNDHQPSEKAIREYLELYIRFRLKVKAAYEVHLDTLPIQQAEFDVFRNQVAAGYLHDEAALDKLVREAIERSRKDIHLAQIYFPFSGADSATPGFTDTGKAFQKCREAYSQLQKGIPFDKVASRYASDQSEIGYITVFTLPYLMENIAYSTRAGQHAAPYRSRLGYHIFKNLGERKAAGKIRVAQILFAFPPGADMALKASVKKQADSVYQALRSGADFSGMVKMFSNDITSMPANGELPEFGVGAYEPAFENAVFSLDKNGTISRPVLSSFGYHIVKKIAGGSITTEPASDSLVAAFRQMVMEDDRLEVAKLAVRQKMISVTGLKIAPVKESLLKAFTDSIMLNKTTPRFPGLTKETVLFSFPKQNFIVSDWIKYLQEERNGQYLDNSSFTPLLSQYRLSITEKYYLKNLEDLNGEFAAQMKEFREGNLLFEIMQRNIWDKAGSDTIGLKNFYNSRKEKYNWEPGADAILFSCTDSTTAFELKRQLAGKIQQWRSVIALFGNKVQADSGRFEAAQLPAGQKDLIAPGGTTIPFQNSASPGVYTFAGIVRVYAEKEQRNFDDAKGFVINDYQSYLEENWIMQLKKTYPISVNNTVLKTLWR